MPQNPLILGGRNFAFDDLSTNRSLITDISGKKYLIYYIKLLIYFLELALLRRASSDLLNSKMIISEDEWLPFRSGRFDGAISCMHSHWIENLKGKFK